MNLFSAIDIAGSGIDAAQTWIDTSAGNLANANDVVATTSPAYAQQTPVFTPVAVPGAAGEAVRVSNIALGPTAGRVQYDPSSPLANAQGDVRVPAVDTATQLVGLVQAQNDYQANTVALSRAKAAYQAALTLGS